jgi:hypothetical protein
VTAGTDSGAVGRCFLSAGCRFSGSIASCCRRNTTAAERTTASVGTGVPSRSESENRHRLQNFIGLPSYLPSCTMFLKSERRTSMNATTSRHHTESQKCRNSSSPCQRSKNRWFNLNQGGRYLPHLSQHYPYPSSKPRTPAMRLDPLHGGKDNTIVMTVVTQR